jgi:hypothetical protein
MKIAGKGHNKTLEVINRLERMNTATDVADGHVSENGGTCSRLEIVNGMSLVEMDQ